jgi:tetracycline 7-halogenase / FADH2 O2-dependent halogenase
MSFAIDVFSHNKGLQFWIPVGSETDCNNPPCHFHHGTNPLNLLYDVVILGSGFGGSLLATLLSSQGKSVLLLDTNSHPRFAIGESATPLADNLLARMAERYQLPELAVLSKYGRWKSQLPELGCGLKRGFTYLGEDNSPDSTCDIRRTLVAASSSDELGDTHWLRSDVDAFFFRMAQNGGATCFQNCQYSVSQAQDAWTLVGTASNEATWEANANFIVDATGGPNAMLRLLDIPAQTHQLRTNSRTLYAHFADVTRCTEMLAARKLSQTAFPFDCDAAAVHFLIDDGWMWQLRFDDDTVSAGFMIGAGADSVTSAVWDSAHAIEEFHDRIASSSFLATQFQNASIVRPESGLQATCRLQRLTTQAAAANWAALPHTAGFVDPLHSTGIAHTLTAVQRLADILLGATTRDQRSRLLHQYSSKLIDEIRCVDELVDGCYAAIPDFDLFCDWTMLYFAAVTSAEQQMDAKSAGHAAASFLHANDIQFRNVVRNARNQLESACRDPSSSNKRHFRNELRKALTPWNHAGLLDDTVDGLYSTTVAR